MDFCVLPSAVPAEVHWDGRSFPFTGAADTHAPAAGWQSAPADKLWPSRRFLSDDFISQTWYMALALLPSSVTTFVFFLSLGDLTYLYLQWSPACPTTTGSTSSNLALCSLAVCPPESQLLTTLNTSANMSNLFSDKSPCTLLSASLCAFVQLPTTKCNNFRCTYWDEVNTEDHNAAKEECGWLAEAPGAVLQQY